MKPKRKTYIYRHGEFVTEKPSAREAAEYANTTPMVVKNIVQGVTKMSRNGWTFSYEPLSLDEMEELKRLTAEKELKKNKVERINDSCELDLGSCKFEVDCKDGRAFDIPRSKDEKKSKLYQLFLIELGGNKYDYTKTIAAMKREFFKELLKAI